MQLSYPTSLDITYLDSAEKIIDQGIEKAKSDPGPKAIIVSGGIDSSTLYALSLKIFPDLKAYSLISRQSQDLPFIKILEKDLKRKINLVNIDDYPQDFLTERMKFYQFKLDKLKTNSSSDQVAIAVGFDLLFQKIHQDNLKTVLTAQGPDVLLGGYHRYRHLSGQELKEKIKEDVSSLTVDIKRDSLVAKENKIKLVNPYLSSDFIDFCLNLPIELIRYQGQNKYLLRLLADKLNLNQEIVNRPKKAFQYSTRIDKILKKINV